VKRAALLWSAPGGTDSLATPLRLQLGQNRHFTLPGNCEYEPKYSRKLDVWFYLSRWHQFPQQPGSLFWCHTMVTLHFTHVRSFACRGKLPNLRADFFTVGLFCVKITWQQIFVCSVQVTILGVLPHETVERRHRGR